MNATRWRQETGQTMPEATVRLLAWMARAHGDTSLSLEEICEEIRVGLCELLEARSCVVFTRDSSQNHFALMAASEGFQSLLDGPSPRTFPAEELLAMMPHEPFFIAGAAPELQSQIGHIYDGLREGVNAEYTSLPINAATPEASSSAMLLGTSLRGAENIVSENVASESSDTSPTTEIMPSLIVPLRQHVHTNTEGNASPTQPSSEICGLAMLWISTPEGELPGDLKPALYAAARQAGAWLATALRFERLSTSYRKLGDVFALISDVKAPKRAGHSQAVAYYARLIAREMQLPEEEAERVEFAGLLHAIGKVAVPDFILTKEDPLTDEELKTVRNSIAAGSQWLNGVDGLQEVTVMVKHQGEHWDGSGYPDGLVGEGIPLGARILAVASRFSAMTRPRVQRRPFPVGGALETLARDSGTQLDPAVLAAFMNGMGRTL